MGRPSLKEQRRSQILDAAEDCVMKFGIGGLTLEKVAEVAGVARPLIRHNLGNRDDIILMMVKRFLGRSEQYSQEIEEALPAENPFSQYVDWLFDERMSDPKFALLGNSLVSAVHFYPGIEASMADWSNDFIKRLESVAAKQFPDASALKRRDTVLAIAAMYFSVESMQLAGELEGFRSACRKASQTLVELLER